MKNLIILMAIVFAFATVGIAATPRPMPDKKKPAVTQTSKQVNTTTASKSDASKKAAVQHKLALKKRHSKMHASAKSRTARKTTGKAATKNVRSAKETKPEGTK